MQPLPPLPVMVEGGYFYEHHTRNHNGFLRAGVGAPDPRSPGRQFDPAGGCDAAVRWPRLDDSRWDRRRHPLPQARWHRRQLRQPARRQLRMGCSGKCHHFCAGTSDADGSRLRGGPGSAGQRDGYSGNLLVPAHRGPGSLPGRH